MKEIKTILSLLTLVLCACSCSGCFILAFPVAALVGHEIQESNEEYDNIIVNFSYKYKIYYDKRNAENAIKIERGESPDKIESFEVWLSEQGTTVKEKKAIARYFRLKKEQK